MSGTDAHCPNGMLGLLIKKHYPGLIELEDGRKVVPWHWPDFYKVKDAQGVSSATKIKTEFWVSLHCTALSIHIRSTFLNK
jgi:hypothetical protein